MIKSQIVACFALISMASFAFGETVEIQWQDPEEYSDLGTDFHFNIGRRFHSNDQFFYEKELISQWLRTELPDIVEMAGL